MSEANRLQTAKTRRDFLRLTAAIGAEIAFGDFLRRVDESELSAQDIYELAMAFDDKRQRDSLRIRLPVRDIELRQNLMEKLAKNPDKLDELDADLIRAAEPPLGAIVASDLTTRFSGGASGVAATSLGGAMSNNAWAGGSLHDLFDEVSGDENAASESEYRCIYLRNGHATLTLLASKFWINPETAGGASVAVGLGAATDAANAATPTATGPVANEDTAPGGVTFSTPTTKTAGLSVGNVGAGFAFPVWIRRTTANTAAIDNDGATFNWEGDTAA